MLVIEITSYEWVRVEMGLLLDETTIVGKGMDKK